MVCVLFEFQNWMIDLLLLLLCSFSQYLLSSYYVSGILVGVGKYRTRETKMPLPCSLHLSGVFFLSAFNKPY